jgi:phosphoribosylformylglycinamidine synthase
MAEFKAAAKLILGVCNGFQVLMKSGVLLPDRDDQGPLATLTWNDSGKFEDRWVHLTVVAGNCVFLRGAETFYLPVAHAEGKFVARDESALARLESQGRVALRYAGPAADAGPAVPYPWNPNGSMSNVAGVCDDTGRVLGLMPHPERHIDPTHHPRWTRRPWREKGDGLLVFENAVAYFA